MVICGVNLVSVMLEEVEKNEASLFVALRFVHSWSCPSVPRFTRNVVCFYVSGCCVTIG